MLPSSIPGRDRGIEERLGRRTVTTGCGQGTSTVQSLKNWKTSAYPKYGYQKKRFTGYSNVSKITIRFTENQGCPWMRPLPTDEVIVFIEDVGRHNAVDAIAGKMLLDGMSGEDKVFYTTGRLTSEMVLKVAQMGIPS